jgi:hypothetical protein
MLCLWDLLSASCVIATCHLSNRELLKLYHGEALKEEFASITKDIEALFPA